MISIKVNFLKYVCTTLVNSLNCNIIGTELSKYQQNSICAILEYTADQLQIVRNDYESKLQCGVNDTSEIADFNRHKVGIRFDPTIF